MRYPIIPKPIIAKSAIRMRYFIVTFVAYITYLYLSIIKWLFQVIEMGYTQIKNPAVGYILGQGKKMVKICVSISKIYLI